MTGFSKRYDISFDRLTDLQAIDKPESKSQVNAQSQITVPVRCDHQVQHVPGVLSMGNGSPHMYRVRTIKNEMIPQEIFEKMQFYLVIFRPK